MNSCPLEVLVGGEEALLAGLGLKNRCRFSDFEPGMLYTFCAMSKLISLLVLPCAKSIRWICLRMLERLDFGDFFDRVWMTPSDKCFPLQNIPVREMMMSHSVLGLVIRLTCPFLHLLFII